jgi:hypothetical protein
MAVGNAKEKIMLPRSSLPQISEDQFDEFRNYMNDQGISSKIVRIPAKDLKPIQRHMKKSKIKALYDEGDFSAPIIVSEDMYIMDGHHRWVAALLKRTKITCLQFNCPIVKLFELGHLFDGSFVKSVSETTIYTV